LRLAEAKSSFAKSPFPFDFAFAQRPAPWATI